MKLEYVFDGNEIKDILHRGTSVIVREERKGNIIKEGWLNNNLVMVDTKDNEYLIQAEQLYTILENNKPVEVYLYGENAYNRLDELKARANDYVVYGIKVNSLEMYI